MEAFIGEIRMFAGNFAPRDWALCDGQLLPIPGNEALFSILGPTYGGDGRQNFALPDLRGRAAVHAGEGSGLSRRRLGDKGGNLLAANGTTGDDVRNTPTLCVNYIICVVGIFPSRG